MTAPMTSREALLPCPFCGKSPYVEMTGFHLGGRTIRCETNDCMGPHTTAACMDDAAIQWNRRAGLAQAEQEPVAWRYKCQDGSEVLMLKRLTDEQKRLGYYTGEDGEDEVDGDEAIVGPFHWAEETPLYASPVTSTDRGQPMNDNSKDYFPCAACGEMTHIDNLDGKPEPHNQPDPEGMTDWTRLECSACYGPGYVSNLTDRAADGNTYRYHATGLPAGGDIDTVGRPPAMIPVDPHQPLIRVRWPHGGWLIWNWHTCKWDFQP